MREKEQREDRQEGEEGREEGNRRINGKPGR